MDSETCNSSCEVSLMCVAGNLSGIVRCINCKKYFVKIPVRCVEIDPQKCRLHIIERHFVWCTTCDSEMRRKLKMTDEAEEV